MSSEPRPSSGRGSLPPTAAEVAFVGATSGLTGPQLRSLQIVLMEYGPVELHFAGREGADVQVGEIAERLRLWRMLHPSEDAGPEPACRGDVEFPPREDADRFRDIVDAAGVLVAAPATAEPNPGSWTWWAVGYARERGRPVVLVKPDGSAARWEQRARR